MVEQLRKYIDDPQSLLRDWRLAQTRAMREAIAGQLAKDAPGWPVEQILHDDVSEPEHRPVDRAGQTRRLLLGRTALHAAARIEARLLARQFLLAITALVLALILGSLALIASKGGLVFTRGSSAAGFSLAAIGVYLLNLGGRVGQCFSLSSIPHLVNSAAITRYREKSGLPPFGCRCSPQVHA
ncbi:hypothetical protein [Pseudomonas aeruginosa]|uniref:hypothetical protein n=1 Tax=Pseudomonas aeruginosa TaxID=287 RepID=UPI0025B02885|nr:hypothetical protein [Pseudomonas aeruginosa]